MKMAKIIVITDDNKAIIAEQADARCDKPFIAFAAISSCDFAQFVPGLTIVVTAENGEYLRGFTPVGFRVGIYKQKAAGFEANDVGVFGESAWASPGIKDFVINGAWMNVHRIPF